MISITGLTKRYPQAARPALAGIDLEIPEGCIFGLLGPNGAGKTTLLSILTGLLLKDAGRVRVAGIDLDADTHAVRRLISYVPQALAFYPSLSIAENLRLFAALSSGNTRARTEFAITAADLGAHLNQRAESLSGGLQRRLNLAIGLLGQSRLLFLDEPTAGVDPQSRHFLMATIRRLRNEGMTIVYSTHYMEEIEKTCERIAILDHGRVIAEGSLQSLLDESGGNLESLFLQLTDAALREPQ